MPQVGGAVKREGDLRGAVKPCRIPRDETDEYFTSFKEFTKLAELRAKAGLMAKGVHVVVAQSPNPSQRPVFLLMMRRFSGAVSEEVRDRFDRLKEAARELRHDLVDFRERFDGDCHNMVLRRTFVDE
jgi:hypothetical protein